MAQMTVRTSAELVERVKQAASAAGKSMNEYVNLVLDAATDADLAGSEAERVRERLARAGLLAPAREGRATRPDPERIEEAGARAARGRPLSDLVSEGR